MLDTNPTALRVLRRNMAVWIQSDSVPITLTRITRVSTPAGGTADGVVQTLTPQTFRITPFKRRLSNFVQNTQDGQIPQADYVLTGPWDTNVERGDTFSYNGDQYEVISIEPLTDDRPRTDRVVAQVKMQGKS